ncbi:hypothetical protein ABH922_000213 [Rhodococcus sp. 27YEA15]|uniref:PE-PPE domain-containing protein n=1 Tax=Rhodococcus sp. 27YEA15 TaxID=3156259 RepID=UPI003C7B57E1
MRKHTLPVAFGLAVGATLVAPALSGAAPDNDNWCPPGAVFAVGGTWDPTGQTTQPVTSRYAAQGYTVNPVTYPASFWPLGDQTYDASVAAGVQSLRGDVEAFHTSCPSSRIVVTGYSQGARIAGDVLDSLAHDEFVPSSQVTGILYSDPRNSSGGIETVVPNLIPGATMTGPRDGFGDIPVHEVCIEGDGICNMPNPLDAPSVFVDSVFGYFTKHNTYQPVMTESTPPPPLSVVIDSPASRLPLPDVATAVIDRVVENLTPYVRAAVSAGLGRGN